MNPRRINLTVAKRVRRSGGSSYRVWIAQLKSRDVDDHPDIPVTTPLRSVIDADAAGTDTYLLRQALDTIERQRLASISDVERLRRTFDTRGVR